MSLQLLEDAQLQLDELEAAYFQIMKGRFRVKSFCITDFTYGPIIAPSRNWTQSYQIFWSNKR